MYRLMRIGGSGSGSSGVTVSVLLVIAAQCVSVYRTHEIMTGVFTPVGEGGRGGRSVRGKLIST